MIYAIASHFSLGIALLDLTQYISHVDMTLGRLPLHCMLSIESVDSLYNKDSKIDSVAAFTSLCNALDNYTELSKVLIVLTASNLSHIDARLRQKIDHVVEMPMCRASIAEKMFKLYQPKMSHEEISRAAKQIGGLSVAPATLEKCLQDIEEFDLDELMAMHNFQKESQTSLYA